jgi:hypothetical protein
MQCAVGACVNEYRALRAHIQLLSSLAAYIVISEYAHLQLNNGIAAIDISLAVHILLVRCQRRRTQSMTY